MFSLWRCQGEQRKAKYQGRALDSAAPSWPRTCTALTPTMAVQSSPKEEENPMVERPSLTNVKIVPRRQRVGCLGQEAYDKNLTKFRDC